MFGIEKNFPSMLGAQVVPLESFSLLALAVHAFYKAFMVYDFLLLYLISTVLVLVFLVFKNFVLLSALLISHTGAS